METVKVFGPPLKKKRCFVVLLGTLARQEKKAIAADAIIDMTREPEKNAQETQGLLSFRFVCRHSWAASVFQGAANYAHAARNRGHLFAFNASTSDFFSPRGHDGALRPLLALW